MQQSTHGGAAINKQSTRLDKEEEEKKKFSFFFSFFPSLFDSATIAAGKEVEKAAVGEPERPGYGKYGDIASDAAATEVDPLGQRARQQGAGGGEMGHDGARRRRLVGRGAGGRR